MPETVPWISLKFQVVPPCGGHHLFRHHIVLSSQFQVVPPCGGHPGYVVVAAAKVGVSSRAPVWGASRGKQTDPEGKGGFKSCPRVGGIDRTNQVYIH